MAGRLPALRPISQAEMDARINLVYPNPGHLPLVMSLEGNEDLEPEELWALEAGYRASLWDDFSLDLAVYYNIYNNLVAIPIPGGTPS